MLILFSMSHLFLLLFESLFPLPWFRSVSLPLSLELYCLWPPVRTGPWVMCGQNPLASLKGYLLGWGGRRSLWKLFTSSEHNWAQNPGFTARGVESTYIRLSKSAMLQLIILPHTLRREEMMGRSLFSCHQVLRFHTSASTVWMLRPGQWQSALSLPKGYCCSTT